MRRRLGSNNKIKGKKPPKQGLVQHLFARNSSIQKDENGFWFISDASRHNNHCKLVDSNCALFNGVDDIVVFIGESLNDIDDLKFVVKSGDDWIEEDKENFEYIKVDNTLIVGKSSDSYYSGKLIEVKGYNENGDLIFNPKFSTGNGDTIYDAFRLSDGEINNSFPVYLWNDSINWDDAGNFGN